MIDEVHRLFAEVADLDAPSRASYFDEHRVTPETRQEIESLLHFDRSGADVLTGVVASTIEQFLESEPEKYCGPYELIRPLGQGGMGSVHLAQRRDGEVDLQVAIKFIRGADARVLFRERFLTERQILASVDHPGIARLLDAGHTKSGQPYLVMEYVDGVPIDTYCKSQPFDAKLKLFLAVCDAIAYLHRHLIIHRDLKPANILINAQGAPKILDFGIAKILDQSADPAVTNVRMLTPQYASPEQVQGFAKTTATDVYSLGAILYELMTGQSPHTVPAATKGATKPIEEIICSVDPVPMRSMNRASRAIPADLEFVVRRALRKEPADRYATVDAFAADLGAVLESRPVTARSGDAWYRVSKFARRQWLPIAAIAAAILSLSIGLYTAHRQTAIAQRRFAQLHQLSTRVLGFDETLQGIPGSTAVREMITNVSTEYLDGMVREAGNDAGLKLDAAKGYLQTAQIQGVPLMPSLGHFNDAEASLAKAAALVESVLASGDRRADTLMTATEIEQYRTIIADTLHESDAELVHAERSAKYAERVLAAPDVTIDQKRDLTRTFNNLGQAEMNLHLYPQAMVLMKRGIDLGQSAGAWGGAVAQGWSLLANARRQSGDLDGALIAIDKAVALMQGAEVGDDMARSAALYAIYMRRGFILGDQNSLSLNRPAEAEQAFQQAYDAAEGMSARDPNDYSFRERVGNAGLNLGDVVRHRDPARALAIYDHTLMRLREIKNGPGARRYEARVLAHSSYALLALHRDADARQRIDQSFAVLRPMGTSIAIVGNMGGEWDSAMHASADYELSTGHADRAREILLDLHSKLLAAQPDPENDLRHAYDMSHLYEAVMRVDAKLGNREEQMKFEALRSDLWRAWDRKLPGNSFIQKQLQKPLLDSPPHSAK